MALEPYHLVVVVVDFYQSASIQRVWSQFGIGSLRDNCALLVVILIEFLILVSCQIPILIFVPLASSILKYGI